MSEGELLQIEKSRSLDIDETVYFEIIKKKTASLISSCCKIAAVSVTKQKKIIDKESRLDLCMKEYAILTDKNNDGDFK